MKKVEQTGMKDTKSVIDKLVYIAAIGYPLMTLPQITQIYSSGSAEDLSLLF